MNEPLCFKMNIVIGDWANDGHGRTETIHINSNLSPDTITEAFQKGSKKVGFNLKDIASHYEDNTIPAKHLRKLIELGLEVAPLDEVSWEGCYDDDELHSFEDALAADDEDFSIDPKFFMKMYLFIAKQAEPTLQYAVIDVPSINIAGYGLFFG